MKFNNHFELNTVAYQHTGLPNQFHAWLIFGIKTSCCMFLFFSIVVVYFLIPQSLGLLTVVVAPVFLSNVFQVLAGGQFVEYQQRLKMVKYYISSLIHVCIPCTLNEICLGPSFFVLFNFPRFCTITSKNINTYLNLSNRDFTNFLDQ